MFDIANDAFEGAVERFSRFFIAPKFDASCTEREMNAVNSEYNLNIQQDAWRKFQLEHSLSKKGNPYNRFTIGKTSTLQFPDTREVTPLEINTFSSICSSSIRNTIRQIK
jgi:insulysin